MKPPHGPLRQQDANAHPLILGIAAYCLALAGSVDEARNYLATIRTRRPKYAVADFLDAFRFDADGVAMIRDAAARIEKGAGRRQHRKAT